MYVTVYNIMCACTSCVLNMYYPIKIHYLSKVVVYELLVLVLYSTLEWSFPAGLWAKFVWEVIDCLQVASYHLVNTYTFLLWSITSCYCTVVSYFPNIE